MTNNTPTTGRDAYIMGANGALFAMPAHVRNDPTKRIAWLSSWAKAMGCPLARACRAINQHNSK